MVEIKCAKCHFDCIYNIIIIYNIYIYYNVSIIYNFSMLSLRIYWSFIIHRLLEEFVALTPCSAFLPSDMPESSVTMNMNEEVNTELHFVLGQMTVPVEV